MKNAVYITDSGCARIATPYGEIVTTRLHKDRYVRIDDGRNYPQLCEGAGRMGATLVYLSPDSLARECQAKLYKTEAGYTRAAQRILDSRD